MSICHHDRIIILVIINNKVIVKILYHRIIINSHILSLHVNHKHNEQYSSHRYVNISHSHQLNINNQPLRLYINSINMVKNINSKIGTINKIKIGLINEVNSPISINNLHLSATTQVTHLITYQLAITIVIITTTLHQEQPNNTINLSTQVGH